MSFTNYKTRCLNKSIYKQEYLVKEKMDFFFFFFFFGGVGVVIGTVVVTDTKITENSRLPSKF